MPGVKTFDSVGIVRPAPRASISERQIADQRSAQFPVTFALHIVLLLEHNRCCTEIAPEHGYEGDEVSAGEALLYFSFVIFIMAYSMVYAPRVFGSAPGDGGLFPRWVLLLVLKMKTISHNHIECLAYTLVVKSLPSTVLL